MASIRLLYSLLLLPLIACGGGGEDQPTPEGPHYAYVASQLFVPVNNAGPQTGRRLAQSLRIELCHVKAQFNALVELIRFEFADRDAADELLESRLSERQEDVRKPHFPPG